MTEKEKDLRPTVVGVIVTTGIIGSYDKLPHVNKKKIHYLSVAQFFNITCWKIILNKIYYTFCNL